MLGGGGGVVGVGGGEGVYWRGPQQTDSITSGVLLWLPAELRSCV